MRKLLCVAALAAVLCFSAFTTEADAHPFIPCATVVAGSASGVTLGAVLSTFAPAAIFAVIATNTPNPLCQINGVTCEGTYPNDPKNATDYYAPKQVAYHPATNHKPHHVWVNGVETIVSE